MKTPLDTAAAESLRSFALAHTAELDNALAFVHLVTQAVGGDEWAVEQIAQAIRLVALIEKGGAVRPNLRLAVILGTRTTRPDGARDAADDYADCGADS